MKIGNLLVNAAYLGERVLTAIAVGAAKAWEGVSKYIKFADPVVESLCMKWSSDGVGLTPEDAAKVTDIGTTFQGNTEITSFDELESFENVARIDNNAFKNCTSLTRVTLPPNDVVIGNNAFYGCSELEAIGNMESITSLFSDSLAYTSKLTEVGFPNLQTIGARVFDSSGITKVTSIGNISSITDAAIRKCPNLEEVVLPYLDLTIGAYAFSSNPKLSKINIHDKVVSIGDYAFYDCSSLSGELNLPNLTNLGVVSFRNTAITKVLSLGSITTIGAASTNGTFALCSKLEHVVLPPTITEIANYGFYNCPKLTTLILQSVTPPTLGANSFFQTRNFTAYVPNDSVEAYKSATNWSAYADRIKPMSEYVEPTNE